MKMKRGFFYFIVVIIWGCFSSYALAFVKIEENNFPASGVLKISVFDLNATPHVGSQLTYDPMLNSADLSLRAKGMVLSGVGKPIVLCAVDWIGIGNESQEVFKAALAEAAGTIPERVAIHTVHQHDAPICDFTAEKILKAHNMPPGCFDGTFARTLIRDIQEAIRTSLSNAQPVTAVGLGKAPVYKVASNRRVNKHNGKIVSMRGSSEQDSLIRAMPEGLIDPDVSLISFWNGDKPLAVLSFYATHPQSYYLTKIANPDFPGIARFIRQLAVPDALHIHFNGAGGNIAAGKYNDGNPENRYTLALRLADGMKRAWENTEKYDIQGKDIDWITEPLFLPYNPKVAEIEKTMSQMNERFLANNMGRLGWYKRRLNGKSIEAACLAIGNARILFMPGELFVEYQLKAKSMAPDKFVAMAAYGDYGPFYIGTREAYDEGGYEIESSPVTAEVEEYLLRAIETLLKNADIRKALLKKKNYDGNYRQEREKHRQEILKNMQKVMGTFPATELHKNKSGINYTDSSVYKNYVRYSINFLAAPSERVYAYLYKPSGESQKYPAILALHSTGAEGKRIVDDATSIKDRGYAKELAQRGYVVIAPDYPGFGEMSDYDFENDRYSSGTMKGIFNHIACIDFLESLNYVDKNRIGVIGHSLGGHNAIFVAAFDERIKATVSSCGWTLMDYYNAGEEISERYGGRMGPWAQDRYMPRIRTEYGLNSKRIPFDFDKIIASLAPRAFFSNSPLNDINFSVEGVRKGAEEIAEVYRLANASDRFTIVYPSCGHDFPPEIREQAYDFIDRFLK